MSVHDAPDQRSAIDPALTAQALLYTHGELDGPEVVAFEALLGADQAAREALCQAVQLTQTLGGMPANLPDPGYRARVCRQLMKAVLPGNGEPRHGLKGKNWFSELVQPRLYPGHPVMWALAGAVAAAVVIGFWLQPISPALPRPQFVQANQPFVKVPTRESAVPASPAAPELRAGAASEMAEVWAELNSDDHLIRVWAQEQKRRHRVEERRLVRTEGRTGQGITH